MFPMYLLVGALLAEVSVSPEGPYTSINQALTAAAPGAVITVHPGIYHERLVIDKTVSLRGKPGAVLDGSGTGTVVRLVAAETVFEGFVVRGSGTTLDKEDAGIVVQAPNVSVRNNQITDVLFGIRVEQAPGAIITGNVIEGKDLDVPRRGDSIKVWYSDGAHLESNVVKNTRDLVIWYTPNAVVRGNHVTQSRYGLHLMFDDGLLAEQNLLQNNSVGAYLMYSQNVTLRRNVMAGSSGPSGFGVGLKDVDRALLQDNLLIGDRVGVYSDNSPRGGDAEQAIRFERNAFIGNGTGVLFQPAVRFNFLVRNTFINNDEQVGIDGGGSLKDIMWTEGGQGNFWSDYRGFDANGDGVGDLVYQSRRVVERLSNEYPALRFFLATPLAQALDIGARAFPIFQPVPKLTDAAPLMRPVLPDDLPQPDVAQFSPGWPIGTLALALPGLLLMLLRFRPVRQEALIFPALDDRRKKWSADATTEPRPQPSVIVEVRGLTKRFGRYIAVSNISFSLAPGEALALWGSNGAGKSTVLRCLLGLLHAEGQVRIGPFDVARHGREARRMLGYVPQEQPLLEGTLLQQLEFFAQLKGIPVNRATAVLQQMGLEDMAGRAVGTLSGGMRQRALLAAALLADPAVLLLDEPTANLDPDARDELLALLSALKAQGVAIIFASHRMEEVTALADSVLPLAVGKASAAPVELAAWIMHEREVAHVSGR